MLTTEKTTEIRPEDLPAWMRPRERSIDWGLWIILAFCLLALWPFILMPGLPEYSNAELYEYRSLEVSRLLCAGVWFSRWAPDLNYALGSPLFNYLAPLPHYLTGYHQAITETDATTSIKLALSMCILAAGTGMFLFARQRWGSRAGVLGGMIYLFSPPISLTLPYLQGELAVLMAMGLLPWVLWAFDRLWKAPLRRAIWLAAGLLSALILSDTRIAFLGFVILLVSLASTRKPTYRHALTAILAAAGFTAFFWMPALLEQGQVKWAAVAANAYSGSVPLDEIFAAIPRFGSKMLNVPIYRGIGPATVILALIGTATLIVHALRKSRPVDGLAFLLAGLLLLILTTPLLYGLWPSPYTFQPLLPYHALIVAVFCFAVVGAQAAHWFDVIAERWRTIGLVSLCLLPTIFSLPTVYLPDWSPVAQPTTYLAGLQEELHGYQIGSFREGILLPNRAPQLPAPPAELLSEFQTDTFTRIGRQAASASQISILERGLLHEYYRFESSQPLSFEFYAFAFPGWTATVDGRVQEIRTTDAGLVAVDVPANAQELIIRMDGTPLHAFAWAVSLFSLLIVMIVVWKLPVTLTKPARSLLPRRETVGLMLTLAIYAAGSILWLSQRPTLLTLRAPLDELSEEPHTAQLMGSGLALVNYSFAATTLRSGDLLRFTVFWEAQNRMADDYQITFQVANSATQQLVISTVRHHPGGIPTSRWPENKFIRDDYSVILPFDLPAGRYSVTLQVSACNNHQLTPCDEANAPKGLINIPTVIVIR